MKNLPKTIYLNIGELMGAEFEELDFNNLTEVTFCKDKVHKNDIKYILVKRKTKKRRIK